MDSKLFIVNFLFSFLLRANLFVFVYLLLITFGASFKSQSTE